MTANRKGRKVALDAGTRSFEFGSFIPMELTPNWFATSSMNREERKRERAEEGEKSLLCLSMTIVVADGHLIESIGFYGSSKHSRGERKTLRERD